MKKYQRSAAILAAGPPASCRRATGPPTGRLEAGVPILFLALMLLATSVFAVSITPEVSTLGYGGSAGFELTPLFGVRVAGHIGSYSRDLNEDAKYDGKLELNNGGALLDVYPFASGFRLSAGAFANGNKIKLVSKPANPIIVNGHPYSTGIGNITGQVKFNKTSPYAGIGWGSKPSGRGFGLTFDVGVLYQGTPMVELIGHTATFTPPGWDADIQAERANVEHDIRNYKYYPVVGIGLSFGF